MNIKAIVLGAALMLSTAVDATIFVVQLSGARFGNSAVATGRSDINTAVYPTLNNSRPSFAPIAPEAMNVPEPSSWALLLAGFGIIGVAAGRRAARAVTA